MKTSSYICNQFIDYVESWSNVIQIDGRWYITRDISWTLDIMRQEGWEVALIGDSVLMPDDSIRQEFSVCN